MAIRIDRPIVDYRVHKGEPAQADGSTQQTQQDAAGQSADKKTLGSESGDSGTREQRQDVISMHEALERPFELYGITYKVKTPVSDHAMYITINDIILNEGTSSEQRRPFEIFINSKNLDHFQWIVALTRIISAVFRKGGDVAFLVEELKAVFDPRGGYWKSGGRFMPSLIAEIGEVIERHLVSIGLIQPEAMSEEKRAMLARKRAEYEARNAQTTQRTTQSEQTARPDRGGGGGERSVRRSEGTEEGTAAPPGENGTAFPAGASLCAKCNTAAVVMLDGCRTCLNCGDSKCN